MNPQMTPYFQTRYPVKSDQRNRIWKEMTRYLQHRFPWGDAILDAGCGYGNFINSIESKNKYAIDICPEVAQFLSQDVRFQSGCLSEIDTLFQAESFSSIFTSNILEHLTRDQIDSFFQGSFHVLRSKGILAIFMPNYRKSYKNYFDDYTHITPISDKGLVDWLESHNFQIIFKHPGFMPFSLKDNKLILHSSLIRLWLHSPWKPKGKQMFIVAQKSR
jgi:predicted SAM-dependent methyltransferase